MKNPAPSGEELNQKEIKNQTNIKPASCHKPIKVN